MDLDNFVNLSLTVHCSGGVSLLKIKLLRWFEKQQKCNQKYFLVGMVLLGTCGIALVLGLLMDFVLVVVFLQRVRERVIIQRCIQEKQFFYLIGNVSFTLAM